MKKSVANSSSTKAKIPANKKPATAKKATAKKATAKKAAAKKTAAKKTAAKKTAAKKTAVKPALAKKKTAAKKAAVKPAPAKKKTAATKAAAKKTAAKKTATAKTPAAKSVPPTRPNLGVLVGRTQLASWANLSEARVTLPILLTKLIRARSAGHITEIDFPTLEATSKPGYDGVLVVDQSTEWYDTGKTVWEMGVDKTPKSKAESDYAKRNSDPTLDKSTTHFRFVTPRVWEGKTEFQAKRSNDGWASVRAFDADDLSAWIERCPSVRAWCLNNLMSRPISGVKDWSSFLDEWSNSTLWPMPPSSLKLDRAKEIHSLAELIAAPPSVVTLQSRSRIDAFAFASHVIAETASRELAVVVDSAAAFSQLSQEYEGALVVLIDFDDPAPLMLQAAVRRGHHIIIHTVEPPIGNVISIPDVSAMSLGEAFENSGWPHDHAYEAAFASRGRFHIIRQEYSATGDFPPPWASQVAATRDLTLMGLLGGWDESREGDRKFVEELTGGTSQNFAEAHAKWIYVDQSPIALDGTTWHLHSQSHTWRHLAAKILPRDVAKFLELAAVVLSEKNPKFELEPKKRWAAAIYKKVFSHSEHLRSGIATGLALMGARGEQVRSGANSAPALVDYCIRTLLHPSGGADWLRWASLEEQLPTLAEASPDAFLTALEASVRAEGFLSGLAATDPGMMTGGHPHIVSTYWALQRLAVSKEHVARVVSLLIRIARVIPDDKRSSPRASTVLREIFLPWRPSTAATVSARIAMLQEAFRSAPEIALKLAISILPAYNSYGEGDAKPAIRDWKRSWQPPTDEDQREFCSQAVKMITQALEDNHVFARDVLRKYDRFEQDEQKKIVDVVMGFADTLGVEERLVICDVLRAVLHHHREFPGMEWALGEERLAPAQKLFDLVEPNTIARHRWLYSLNPESHRPVYRNPNDYHLRIAALDAERRTAAGDIVSHTPAEILEFTKNVQVPGALAKSLVQVPGFVGLKPFSDLLTLVVQGDVDLADAFLHGVALEPEGMSALRTLLPSAHGSESLARVLRALPCDGSTWDIVDAQSAEVQKLYWDRVAVARRIEPTDAEKLVSKLLDYGRVSLALNVSMFALSLERNEDGHPEDDDHEHEGLTPVFPLSSGTLQRLLNELLASDVNQDASFGYAVSLVFRSLRRQRFNDNLMLQLEWTWHQILKDYGGTPLLSGTIGREPQFFHDLFKSCYRAASAVTNDDEAPSRTPEETQRIEAACSILESWSGVPEPAQLRAWVERVLELAKESDRYAVAMVAVGRVLARTTEDADRTWPSREAREILEAVGTEEICRGFISGAFNARGVHIKGIMNGEQERDLAALFAGRAAGVADRYPTTAAALRQIADGYRNDAHREDIRGELGG